MTIGKIVDPSRHDYVVLEDLGNLDLIVLGFLMKV